MKRFTIKEKLGEGSFAVVLLAYDNKRKCNVALKCIKDSFSSLKEAMMDNEIQIFRCLGNHPNIVNLLEVLFCEQNGKLSLVFEYMNACLYDFVLDHKLHTSLSKEKLKFVFFQICNGIAHLHNQGVFHRDIKPENILVDKDTLQVKIADFGCCKGIYDEGYLTEYISTRWYRPPECAIMYGNYSKTMDIWAIACVFFEMITTEPLFPGEDDIHQVYLINAIIGSPSKKLIDFYLQFDINENFQFKFEKGCGLKRYYKQFIERKLDYFDYSFLELLSKMLVYDFRYRPTVEAVLSDKFFQGLNIDDLYSKFLEKDDINKALELVNKILSKKPKHAEISYDLLRKSVFMPSLHKEKILQKVCQQKNLKEKSEVKKHYNKISKEIEEIKHLSLNPKILCSILLKSSKNQIKNKKLALPSLKNSKLKLQNKNIKKTNMKTNNFNKLLTISSIKNESKENQMIKLISSKFKDQALLVPNKHSSVFVETQDNSFKSSFFSKQMISNSIVDNNSQLIISEFDINKSNQQSETVFEKNNSISNAFSFGNEESDFFTSEQDLDQTLQETFHEFKSVQ